MERKRVVHYAKSRTAKVLSPPSTSQSVSSSSASPSEGNSRLAPLASIDSDVLMITKPRDGTNTAPSLTIPLRSPRTTGSRVSSAQRPDRDVALSGHSRPSGQHPDYRTTHSPSEPRHGESRREDRNFNDRKSQQWSQAQHPLPPGSSRSLPRTFNQRSVVDGPGASRSLARCTCNSRNPSGGLNGQQQYCPVHFQRQERGQRAPLTSEAATSVRRNSGGYTKQTVASNTKPSFTPESKNVFPDVSLGNCPNSDSRLSDRRSPDSRSCLSKASSLNEDCVLTANYSDSQGNSRHDQSKSASRTNHEFGNVSGNITQKNNNKPHYQQPSKRPSQYQSENVKNYQSGAPESHLAQNVTLQPRRNPRYEEGRSPDTYRNTNMAHPGSKSQNSRDSYNKHAARSTNKADHHPNSLNNKAYSSLQSDHRNVHYVREVESNGSQAETFTRHHQDMPQISVPKTEIHVYSQSTNEHVSTSNPSADVSADSGLEPEFKPSWKRNSMRMAMQGYTSMSDLTTSIESLTPVIPENESWNYKGSQTVRADEERRPISGNQQRSEDYMLDSAPNHIRDKGFDASRPNHDTKLVKNQTNSKVKVAVPCDVDRPEKNTEQNSQKKVFKLAPTSIGGVWLLEDDMNKLMADMNQNSDADITRISSHTNHSHPKAEHRSRMLSVNSGSKETNLDEVTDEDERTNSLKRLSYMLATSSISDLTCDVDDNQYQTARLIASSPCSGRLNSSFGSYYSCKSTDLSRGKPSPYATPENSRRRCYPSKDMSLVRGTTNDTLDSIENESSASGENSVYYTASSASFVTSDESGSYSTPGSDTKQRSPKIPSFHWTRKSPYPRMDHIPKSTGTPVSVQDKAAALPNRGKATKHSSPINNIIHCYGCGLDSGVNMLAERGRSSPKRRDEKQDRTRDWRQDDRQRSYSTPPPRSRDRHSGTPPRHQPEIRQTYDYSESPEIDESFTSGVPPSPGSDSLISFAPDVSWQDTPRSPPSLGRPKRKLYAGFDSQPLPMDSFLSDSSSVYSEAVSWSSRTTSRSAEVESVHRAPYVNENLSQNARAVSTSASGTRTPTRRMSSEDVVDFFSYTDKRHSLGENNHNLYRSTDNSYSNTCSKDSFYDKTFSNESLISCQSDATTTGADLYDNNDNTTSEDLKPHIDGVFHDCNKMNNNGSVQSNPKRTNETSQQPRLNNSRGSEFGSRLSNNSSHFTNADSWDYKGQHRMLKASSSASAPRPQFPTRRKYFSSKDIIDLLMSEKNAVGAATSLTSLEKQAHKVCKVILCCNEMDRPQVSSREYHF